MFASSVQGELPPPPPRACFGREKLVEKVVGLAENLEPLALIGAGGIGKTSIALTVLHHDRIKKRFGDNRRFIRCEQLPASRPHLLSRLSKVVGAGIENPEDLTSLRPFLSSKEMVLFLDNAESILDPQGTDAREVYTIVEELSRFTNICLGITSRISTVPPHCKRPIISTLSMESACDIFYAIYENDGRSDVISDLVRQLDFHALSITLLATTASHNIWDYDRLSKEWNEQRGQILRTDYNESLAATMELSFASPTFLKLGLSARDLLGVVAFFPQGVDEDNLDWLFPTIPNRKVIFDKFCVLSLTYRSNGFITMLAPIRDYLTPPDPNSSPLLCATKDLYFTRLSVMVDPAHPGFEEARWIVSEDVNVEHLLTVFASIDTDSVAVWDTCINFLRHLYWYKCRYTVLGPKIEGLPDDHRSKSKCLIQLSRLSQSVGNYMEQKRLLTHSLKLERGRQDDFEVARILRRLSGANRELGLHEEGIQQVREALGIYERLDDTTEQADCWDDLSRLLHWDGQLDSAEEAASRAIDLLPEKGQEYNLCQFHLGLGDIYRSKEEPEKALHHLEIALGIASTFKWQSQLLRVNQVLALLFIDNHKLDDANAYIEQAKSHAHNDAYNLGRTMTTQAEIWYRQGRHEGATSEALGALEIFEKLGASKSAGDCKNLLQKIEATVNNR
jgi:tetratricopeptide (TPR) repeat protein